MIRISSSITIVDLVTIIARTMKPTMMIDNITIWLLVIAFVPGLAPLIQSIEWGGAKVEFRQQIKELKAETANMHSKMDEMA